MTMSDRRRCTDEDPKRAASSFTHRPRLLTRDERAGEFAIRVDAVSRLLPLDGE
jgi:hypothetical protein